MRRRVNALSDAAWPEFWRWSMVTFREALQGTERKTVRVIGGSIQSAGIVEIPGKVDGEKVVEPARLEERIAFTCIVQVGAEARLVEKIVVYRRPITSREDRGLATAIYSVIGE